MREQNDPTNKQPERGGEQTSHLHFGNYELVRRIDVGGMGEVYLARQRTAFGRLVAIKIMRSDLVNDMVARQRFLREAEVNAQLKHEHILPLIEFDEEQGRLFLVTPYVEGGTLARRLQRGALSLAEIQQLFSALVRAIAYIHKRGVVHRDLKPSNILLDEEDGQVYVRLIDFGIASIQGDYASPPLTMAGHEMGTIAYLAPERLSGIAAPSNDIFSLGIILSQMITGHLPEANKASVLPAPLEEVVRRATMVNPQERYASADDLLKAFEHACRMLNTSSRLHMPLAPEEDATPTPRRLPSSVLIPAGQESVILRRSESDVALANATEPFRREDYNAQTAFLSPEQLVHLSSAEPAIATPLPHKPKKRSFIGFLSLGVVAILIAMSAMAFFVFESSITARITLSPQVHTLSAVFTLQAQTTLHSINATTASLPASVINSSRQGTQQGPTSTSCILFFCSSRVSPNDVNNIALQIRPGLQNQITQDIQQQLQNQHGMMIGTIQFIDGTVTSDPQIGTQSNTVSVTLTEQGAVEYIKVSDAQTLAKMLLQQKMQQQLGPHYVLLSQYTQIGQPGIKAVDMNGNATLAIAAGGIAEYQLPRDELTVMQNHVKGLKVKDAQSYLLAQPGIDPKSLHIEISYGDALPANSKQIALVPINPMNIPSVSLQPTTLTPTTSNIQPSPQVSPSPTSGGAQPNQ